MTPNAAAQLAILADALTEIVDLASGGLELVAPPVDLLARAGDLAVEALAVAATHGPLPPGVMPVETREDGAILDPPPRHDGVSTAISRLNPPRPSPVNDVR
jgi:hypothetical protein